MSNTIYKIQLYDCLQGKNFSLETFATSQADAEQQGRAWVKQTNKLGFVMVQFLGVSEK